MPMSKRSQRRNSFIISGLAPRAGAYARQALERNRTAPPSRRLSSQAAGPLLAALAQAYVDGVSAAFDLEDGRPLEPIEEPGYVVEVPGHERCGPYRDLEGAKEIAIAKAIDYGTEAEITGPEGTVGWVATADGRIAVRA